MPRPFLFALLASLTLLALQKSASAQTIYSSSVIYYVPVDGGTMVTQGPPRASHDRRIDPHLLRAASIAEARAYPHSTLRCWRYVKDALLQAGAVGARPTSNYACQAGSELSGRYGFVRLPIRNPYSAPVGAVLVYRGGGAGHVEIRTEHGFASDYRSPWACRYHLIGVYAKISV